MTPQEFSLFFHKEIKSNVLPLISGNYIDRVIELYNTIRFPVNESYYHSLMEAINATQCWIEGKEIHSELDKFMKESEIVLCNKAKEYAFNDDRFWNFHQASRLTGGEMDYYFAAWAFGVKHLVSFVDIVQGRLSISAIKEKAGDLRNYVIIMAAINHELRLHEDL